MFQYKFLFGSLWSTFYDLLGLTIYSRKRKITNSSCSVDSLAISLEYIDFDAIEIFDLVFVLLVLLSRIQQTKSQIIIYIKQSDLVSQQLLLLCIQSILP